MRLRRGRIAVAPPALVEQSTHARRLDGEAPLVIRRRPANDRRFGNQTPGDLADHTLGTNAREGPDVLEHVPRTLVGTHALDHRRRQILTAMVARCRLTMHELTARYAGARIPVPHPLCRRAERTEPAPGRFFERVIPGWNRTAGGRVDSSGWLSCGGVGFRHFDPFLTILLLRIRRDNSGKKTPCDPSPSRMRGLMGTITSSTLVFSADSTIGNHRRRDK